ncbi:MAG: polynucleotide adenylyltransferase PcnB [Treponema sp.]|nr:polynucleotide adenylyltransferase PcnB [Treponema sp.]
MLYRYGTDSNGKLVKKAVVYTKDEHLIPLEKIDTDALQIINRLRDAGYIAYIVGGAVRDLIVGNNPKDFDIVTDATPSKIKKIFRNSRIIGRRFRLVHVVFGEKIFEVSTFRSNAEGSVGNEFGTIEQDVLRRDFSLNALYYDPITEQVIDYVGGMKDIKKHVLRPVISLETIFIEDPVRMLRAIKYSATTHAKMSFALRHKIRTSANLLGQISPSRLTEELLKIINSGHSFDIISEAIDTDLFMYLQPSAAAMIFDNKALEEKYMNNLKKLDALTITEPGARLGKKLYFLIYDFVSTLTDWEKETSNKYSSVELYSKTWTECRNFVLPMNPQRRELEYAIKSVLNSFGVNIKASGKNTSASKNSKNTSQKSETKKKQNQ